MTLDQWLEVLNSRVFFWLDRTHLETLMGARAYRDRAHDVIEIDTARLLERERDEITLSPINSGNTMYNPRPRGSRTFLPIADYPFEDRRKARGLRSAVVELAVTHGVAEIGNVVARVERRRAGCAAEAVLWER
ncbi:MAG: hypothetical protein QOH12_2565 [Solirubrobacteraceae bacterium]|jgi:hypothetical protein|nr:hypothetical protein [Solirubrobacteraceae bacterium]